MTIHIKRPAPANYNLEVLVEDGHKQWTGELKAINEILQGGAVNELLFAFVDGVTVTEQDCDDFLAAHDHTGLTDAGTLAAEKATARASIKANAQSAVGVTYDALTVDQLKALLAAVINELGGLAADGSIKPLAEWLRD
jgi:hypothetical protein